MVAIMAKPLEQISPEDYLELLGRLNFQPHILNLKSASV